MSEENKITVTKEEELEKVNGGLGRDEKKQIFNLTAGYYFDSNRYIYLPNNCSGIGATAVSVIVYILQSDGYLHRDNARSFSTFAAVAKMQKLSPEDVPPISGQ
ncbi:MAG: hypothetical protein KBT35_08265 [Firmicutes bacterium]|nr:hypothetical protein [Candidatus Colivicinus equi]